MTKSYSFFDTSTLIQRIPFGLHAHIFVGIWRTIQENMNLLSVYNLEYSFGNPYD